MRLAGRGTMTPAATPTPAVPAESGSDGNAKAAETVRKGATAVGTAARRYGLAARNAARQRRKARLDYVVVPIEGPLAERDARPRPFPLNRLPFLARRPVSLAELRRRVDALAADPRVRGVVFHLRQQSLGLAGAEALRAIFARARRRGLETVAYLTEVSLASYFAATACDRVVALPAGEFNALGLHLSATFLRDTFARAGLRFEVVAVSPYKAAGDSLTRRDMSPEHRQNLDWLLDDLYAHVVGKLSADRGMTPERVRGLLNSAPFDLQHAVEVGLINATLFEDELGDYLGSGDEPVAVVTWESAASRLVVPFRPRPERVIAVLTVAGMIVEGSGRRPPPLPIPAPALAGSRSVVQALRQAAVDKRVAAIVLAIDSPGGSERACAAIAHEVKRVRTLKPVVAYLGATAASGGYYVAAPCNAIITQATTITGSIGVLVVRAVLGGVYDWLGAATVELSRGQSASLYQTVQPWNERQRQQVGRMLVTTYDRFKEVVSTGRRFDSAQLDDIAQGRVWTGRQAVAQGLADCLGDLTTAVEYARTLAHLPDDLDPEVVDVRPRAPELLPETADEASALHRLGLGWIMQAERSEAAAWLEALAAPVTGSGQALTVAPWLIRIRC